MSFQIDPSKNANKEVVSLASKRLLKATQALDCGSPQSLHEARKCLKETRALLRLVREPLGARLFAEENCLLRDVGQRLSEQRDIAAQVECWDKLVATDRRRFGSAAMQKVRGRLVERIPASSLEPQLLAQLQEALQHAGDDMGRLSLGSKGFALFRAGVQRTYQDGRRALAAVLRKPSDKRLHEWRKLVKDHWYQTRLLQAAWPEMFKTRNKHLKILAEWLGDDHDLAIMQALLRAQPTLFGAATTRTSISKGIAARRMQLQAQAIALGQRFYAEKPKALVMHWADLWHLASKQPLVPSETPATPATKMPNQAGSEDESQA